MHYHPFRVNVEVDALRRFSMCSVSHVEEEKKELVKDVQNLAHLRVLLISISDHNVKVYNLP